MPFLALLALRRPRVLAVVLVPAVALVVAARLAPAFLDPATAAGILTLAAAPAALVLAPRAGELGGRRDTAGAFALGTVVVWVALVTTGTPGGSSALPGIQAFGLAAAVAAGLPKLRDAVLGPIRVSGNAALVVLLAAAALTAPAIGPATIGAAAATLALGVLAAAGTARLARRDPPSAMIGSGTRDAGVAVALATTTGPGAVGVPLVYAALLLLGVGLVAVSRRRDRARRPA